MDRRPPDTAREAQMQSKEIPQTVSGAAVALAGFSGVVAVLGLIVALVVAAHDLLPLLSSMGLTS